MASWRAKLLSLLFRVTMKRAARNGINVPFVRARMGTARARVARVPAGCMVSPVTGDGLTFEHVSAAGLAAERAGLAVLYLHGGGYFFGSPQTHRPLTLGMARAARAPVWALDYRLAPEHRYPAALEDAVAAYRWLVRSHPDRRIVLAGDSAGGGLAVATAVTVRDLGLPGPAALICFSPWTDLAATGASLVTNARSCAMFTPESIREAASIYLGGADPLSPGASPLYADLAGLPPTLIFASTDEILLDDSLRLVEKAKARGVMVEIDLLGGVPHVWPLFSRILPEGRDSLAKVADFIDRLVK